jgi:hypothetical protein
VNSRSHCDLLQNHLRPAICSKRRCLLSKGVSPAKQFQASHSICHHDDIVTHEVWGPSTPSLFPRPDAVWFSSVWSTERVLAGTQIHFGWRCPVGHAWVAQGPTTRLLFFRHPSTDFLHVQVHWTAGGLCLNCKQMLSALSQ